MTTTRHIFAVYVYDYPDANPPREDTRCIKIANFVQPENTSDDMAIALAMEDVHAYMALYKGVARFELRAENGVLIATYHIEATRNGRTTGLYVARITHHAGALWVTNPTR